MKIQRWILRAGAEDSRHERNLALLWVQSVRRETRRTSCMSWGRVLLPHAAGYLKQVCGRLDEQAGEPNQKWIGCR